MGSLQGPVVCLSVRAKQEGFPTRPFNISPRLVRLHRSEFWGFKKIDCSKSKVDIHYLQIWKSQFVRCSFRSSADGNGSTAENFNPNDQDYINSSVIEAVEVKSGKDGFMIKMRDGQFLTCVHNDPQAETRPDCDPHPTMVLKMEDGTGLLLPIIVLEVPRMLLQAAMSSVQLARPSLYRVMKEMIEKMGYEVKLVRVTKRVDEAYFARVFLTKIGSDAENVCFDLRPSDAINIAVRCKVPIQVNRALAHSDGMRVVESAKNYPRTPAADGLLFSELDFPSSQPCNETEEFNLVCNMQKAASEERYEDAAQWRDELGQLRARKNKT